MPNERTLSIIKPDAVGNNVIGKILQRFEDNNLKIVASKMMHLSKEKQKDFMQFIKINPFLKNL